MKASGNKIADEARSRLVATGGRIADEMGLGRVVGEILTYLYFSSAEKSPEQIREALGVSKAAVSVAVRQLESLALVRRLRKPGDRKHYYRTADNVVTAIQHGVLGAVRRKLELVAVELDHVQKLIDESPGGSKRDAETRHLYRQLKRAKRVRDVAAAVVGSPLARLLGGL